jgi:Concanavalin A-like lectin/glucanases superfamily
MKTHFKCLAEFLRPALVLGIGVMCGCPLAAAAAGLTNSVPAPFGLVSWWRGEGTASDLAGEADGVLYRGVKFAPGKVGQCFAFDGISSGINVPDVPALALTNSLTVEGWLFVPSAPSAPGMVLFRGDTRSGLDPYYVSVEPQEDTSGMLIFVVWGPDNTNASIKVPMPLGAWTHVAATLDDCAGLMRLYTNAVVAAELTTTIRPLGALDPDYQPGIGIGNHSSQPGRFNYPFRGLIDELSVYNRALSAHEIQAIYGAGSAGKCPLPPSH